MFKSILKLAREDLKFRSDLIKKLAGRTHRDSLPFSVRVSGTGVLERENPLDQSKFYVQGIVDFPGMNWSEQFYLYLKDGSLTDLYIGQMMKVKKHTFWWEFFVYLQTQNLLEE